MLNDDILKALLEGIIYVAPEPVTLDGMVKVLEGEERERVKAKLDELVADYEQNSHGIQIRQVANGYKFSTKAEHHEVLRKYVKNLKPLVRLSKPALETLAVIVYRQPVTMPEIEAIRGVDSGGVIHTLLERKLVVTSGRKSVVGRPILYRTSRDFLVHFGLKDLGELPSLKEFEELAKRALGSEWTGGEAQAAASDSAAVSGAANGVAVVEVSAETAERTLLPIAEDIAPAENPAATESVQTGTEQAARESAEVPPIPLQESASPVAAETGSSDELEPAALPDDFSLPRPQGESGELSAPDAPADGRAAKTSGQPSTSVDVEAAPLENAAKTESESATTDVTGAASVDSAHVSQQEPAAPGEEETVLPETQAAAAPGSPASGSNLPARISAPATEGHSVPTAIPEDDESKP
jgi:segregation and condensation protein B